MKRLHIWLAACVICLSVMGLSLESHASVIWGKNENGIYVNSQGAPIARAVKKGIDVSKYQGTIDWDTVKNTDVEFVIIRCGVGENIEVQDDAQWLRNATECERLGIPYGVYLYSYATTEEKAVSEAEHVLRLIEGRELSYPVYYDLESTSIAGLTAEQHAVVAKAFCDKIEAAGYQTGIYASKSWFETKLTDSWFDSKERWVAHYETSCGYTGAYRMWQCTNTGTVEGVDGSVDINFIVEDAPAQVSFTKAASASYNQHRLTWKAISGAEGYQIWCKEPGSTRYNLLVTTDADTTSGIVKKRTTGKNYSYKIRAFKTINGAIEYGEYSSVKKVKAVPAKTTLSSVKRSSSKKVTIKWQKVSGASGYKIYYSKKKGSGYKLVTTVKKGSTTSVKVNVAKGKRYYKIRAYRTVSGKPVYGSYSAVKSCK